MIFTETPLRGAYLLELERSEDSRGFFARCWNEDEMQARVLVSKINQCSVSFNHSKGTLRGMHFQTSPFEETKIVRCTLGSVYDVIVDLREDSPTFRKWTAFELSAANHRMVYIPEGFAHGFITLEDRSEVFYQISQIYSPEHARGVRWNDPAIGIKWPFQPTVISERDEMHSLLGKIK